MADAKTIGAFTEAVTSLPPNKRYILTHTPAGVSVVHSSPPQLYHGREGVGGMARSYATSTLPPILANDADITAYLAENGPASHKGTNIVIGPGEVAGVHEGNGKGGATLLVVDIAPGGVSQMHRTVSVDFSICVLGVVELALDGGEVLTLNPGDHVVQRGTMHQWRNGSETEPARFVAVTLPCEAFEVGETGRSLREEHLEGTGKVGRDGSKL
ncbi:hypothetical protein BU16DRAFT_543227 [Lophium mytilinum]|uniref:Cupin type-2 domain-containing protein n=1 Tax=Lophium mytilinum TaxID=390894 RepID=A0A6A6QFJ3_9PEZI|nr:hypothetical protein BU16DRAFT_543227 [Lophium mytilinum]